ncbi:transglutaminase superfamily protein [Mumia flava]|uniref:Transglutaminase superfamily protein n=1 Tax=Mumia flava TaxID=1348852 RepID=A0A0B2BQ91_9ACTN|nr:transglutaminase domain-containing protein [Mumia flava]PJJ56036.1 transglutaminase superfamily protein [Mumia flava]
MSTERLARAAWVGLWVWASGLASAIVLAPLLADDLFVGRAATFAGFVVALGVLARGVGLGDGTAVLAEAAGAVACVTYALTPGTGILGVIPTPATLAQIGEILSGAGTHAQQYAPPVPPSPDLDAMLIGAVLALTLLTDAVAVWLGQAVLLGLVWIALYVTPATLVGDDLGIAGFVVSAIAFGGLVVATGPGARRRATSLAELDDDPPTPAGHQATAAAVTAVAIVGAVALAPVLPAATANLLSGTGGSGSGPGSGLTNPVLDMRRNLQEQSNSRMVTVTALDSAPRPRYVRLASLPSLEPDGWTLGDRVGASQPVSDGIPAAPGRDDELEAERARYTATVDPAFATRWLPHLYAPVSVSVGEAEDVQVDRRMLDISRLPDTGTFAGDTYQFASDLSSPTSTQLRLAPSSAITMSAYTRLPEDTPGVVTDRALEVVGNLQDPFDQALALQGWLREDGGFVYDVQSAPGSGMETMEAFLTDERVGYCEQFASAMAMMARALRIPARVAIGFLSGEQGSTDDSWIFRGTDMHAWPELYFAGIGWVGFEPTPGGSGYSPPSFEGGQGGDSSSDESGDAAQQPDEAEATTAPGQVSDSGAAPDGTAADGRRSYALLGLAALALVLLLVAPASIRVLRRRRRTQTRGAGPRAEAAWAEIADTAEDLGLGWDDGLSARAASAPLRARLSSAPDASAALTRIVTELERARYAAEAGDGTPWEDVVVVRDALIAGVDRRRRVRATVMPRSVLRTRSRDRGGDDEHSEVLSLQE